MAIGMARVVDTCIISLLDHRPPHYVDRESGSVIPLPTSSSGRLGYALDLLGSMIGTSFYAGRHWDWASPRVAAYRAPQSISKHRFVLNAVISTIVSYLCLDFIRSYVHLAISPSLRARSRDNYTPITSLLPFWQQLICAFEFFVHVQTTSDIINTGLLVLCVGFGLSSDLDNWPPLFEDPLRSGSLPHFWSQAWHGTYRHFFLRFSLPFIYFLFPSTRDTVIRKAHPVSTNPRIMLMANGEGKAQNGNGLMKSTNHTVQNGDDVTRKRSRTADNKHVDPAVAYVTMILCFVASGIFHLTLIYRVRLATPPGTIPQPPPSLLQFWKHDLSAAIFFMVQPIGITFDMMLLRPVFGASSKVRRIFAWVWVLYTVRWWVDAWAAAGMLDGEEPWLFGSPVRTIIRLLSN